MVTKEQEIFKLQKEIEKLKKSVKKQRYGLVWMDVPEAFEDDVENKLPILKEVPELAVRNNDGKPTHILIEGDNYHALTCLNYTHKGKIDVIYIDPPYNTGSDGFRYKDKRIISKFPDGTEVPKDHPFRHSYWLSFMRKRLELARDLLQEEGVAFISIGKDELANLVLLVKEIFFEQNFIDVLPREQKSGSNQGNFFAPQLDYIIVVSKNLKRLKSFVINKGLIDSKSEKSLYQSSLDPMRGCSNQRYWVKCPDGSFVIPPGKNYPSLGDGEKVKPKNRDDKVWRWSQTRYLAERENILFKKTKRSPLINQDKKSAEWNVYSSNGGSETMLPRDYIFGYTNSMGTKELELLGLKDKFDNPKPTELIKYLISIINSKKDMVILDFFAGSGTTGQAVINMNNDINKNSHQFILVTNNENNIMKEVCYPRIKRVIEGYKKVTKGGNSLKYYKTQFIGKNNILEADDEDKVELAYNAGELLAIAENTLELVKQSKYYQLFENNLKERYTAIYFREELDDFDKFVEIIEKLNKKTAVYVFSWGDDEFNEEFEHVKDVKVKTIPIPILEIYKSIYNLGGYNV